MKTYRRWLRSIFGRCQRMIGAEDSRYHLDLQLKLKMYLLIFDSIFLNFSTIVNYYHSLQPDAIITKWPTQLIESLPYNMPMIIGYNKIEGLVGSVECHKNKRYKIIDKDLRRYIPKTINLDYEDPKCIEFADEIRRFYFSGQAVSDRMKVGLTNLCSDYHFNMELQFVAEMYARYQHK